MVRDLYIILIDPCFLNKHEILLLICIHFLKYFFLHLFKESLKLSSEIFEVNFDEIYLLMFYTLLNAFFLLEEIFIDRLIYDYFEFFVGLWLLIHNASKRRSMWVITKQAKSSILTLKIETNSFNSILMIIANLVHFNIWKWSIFQNNCET